MSQRTLRFAANIRNTLLEVLPGAFKVWDDCGCTITDVAVTKDLSIAKVYVMALYNKEFDFISELNRNSKTISKKVTDNNNFRRAPEVRFLMDETYAHAQECARISELLEEDV